MSLADCVTTHAISESLISHGRMDAAKIKDLTLDRGSLKKTDILQDNMFAMQTNQPVFHLAITDLACSRLAHQSSFLVPMVDKGKSEVYS